MSEGETSFKVREKRRFKDGSEDAASAPEAGETAAGASSATAQTADGAAGENGVDEAGVSAVEAPEGGESLAGDAADFMDEDDLSDEADPSGGQMPDISTAGFMQFMLANLYQLGWQNLGLIPNPATGKVEANLPDARLAIDGYGALLSALSPRLDEVTRREMQTALSNLRINFMEQSKRQGEGQ